MSMQSKPPVHSSTRWFSCVPVLAVVLFSGLAQAQTAMPAAPASSMAHGQMHKDGAGAHDMKQAMMAGMEGMQRMSMSGDVDKDFAMMMKMHHEQALKMAEMELAQGKSRPMKDLARNIITAQKKEIAILDQWLAKQK